MEQAVENGGVQFDATSIYYDLGFVRACGGYIFNYQNGAYDTSDIGLANDGAVQAYHFLDDLCNRYGLITADVTADIARSNFQNGKCAYYIGCLLYTSSSLRQLAASYESHLVFTTQSKGDVI